MRKEFVIKSRGLYPPKNGKPFKVSRSGIESFCECPRCFWLNHKRGIRRPSMPGFAINSLVDRLLKIEFDAYRKNSAPHPYMIKAGLDAIPFNCPQLDDWRTNQRGVQHLHEPTGLLIYGALDDVWQLNASRELITVDYKATSKAAGVSIDEDWQQGYKRQIEVYQWLLRQNGFTVSDTGYFVYCNGMGGYGFEGNVRFDAKLIPYVGSDAWIEPTLLDLKLCLDSPTMPDAPGDCEYCGYVEARRVS
jgi:hypothetical protein